MQVDDVDESFVKLDDSIFDDFRKREEKLEEELRRKDALIQRLLQENQQIVNKAQKAAEGESAADSYTKFIEKRLEESQEENRRYHAKYVDMR